MLEIGDLAYVRVEPCTRILVEVVHQHSGHYDYMYTGVNERHNSVIYFSEDMDGTFYGRVG